MAKSELPRERLIHNGAKSLSNSELLAIFINTGRHGFSSLDIANELLISFNGLKELKHLSINDLTTIKGIDSIKQSSLKLLLN